METTTIAARQQKSVGSISMNVEALSKTPWGLPSVPWRDPHTVSPLELKGYIQALEDKCLDNPGSAELRVFLGMAHGGLFGGLFG